MKTIGVSQFRTHCLRILDELGPEGIVITKRGKPIAELVAADRPNMALYGKYRGKLEVRSDIMSTGIRWNADDVPRAVSH